MGLFSRLYMISPGVQGVLPGGFNLGAHLEVRKFGNNLFDIGVFPDVWVRSAGEDSGQEPTAVEFVIPAQNSPSLVFGQVVVPKEIGAARIGHTQILTPLWLGEYDFDITFDLGFQIGLDFGGGRSRIDEVHGDDCYIFEVGELLEKQGFVEFSGKLLLG